MSELINLRQQLLQKQQRALVILSGENGWQTQYLDGLFQSHEMVFWVSGHFDGNEEFCISRAFSHFDFECIPSKRLRYHLGQEINGAVIDVEQGLSADALGIIAGMIKPGGLLILLTPPTARWLNLPNPENLRFLNTPLQLSQADNGFTQHLIKQWQSDDVIWLEQATNQDLSLPSNTESQAQDLPSKDQQAAIDAIHSVAFGHRKRPLVIDADRGRGKSSALGIAAIDCLLDGKQHIVISASRIDQTLAAFKHAEEALYTLLEQGSDLDLVVSKNGHIEFRYEHQNKLIEFMAPDYLLLNPTSADIVMIDEAAQLPTPLLTELLQRYHRLVFATTLHGYEGSGRGFELRFKKQLDKLTPDWKNIHLQQPIRWSEGDPLESAINRALLLSSPDLDSESASSAKQQLQSLKIETLDRRSLVADTEQLQALFALLVQAHYQTSPNDLQQLLNVPNIKIIAASIIVKGQSRIIAACLCIEEGKLNPTINRAHGHLVPQLLTKNYAQPGFLMLASWRIMRIAVAPQFQRFGIGSQLLAEVEKQASRHQMDYISSSFGANEELLPFWFKTHFWPLHVGAKRDKASGCHNLVVGKPLSAMARQALALNQSLFQEQFPHLLLESLPHLPVQQVLQILQTFRFKKRNTELELALTAYQNLQRPYEAVSNKLWQWSLQSANQLLALSDVQQGIWCDKILKKLSWQDVAHKYHLAGRKGVEKALQEIIAKWQLQNSQQPPKQGLVKDFLS